MLGHTVTSSLTNNLLVSLVIFYVLERVQETIAEGDAKIRTAELISRNRKCGNC